jgi:hypothetical protein
VSALISIFKNLWPDAILARSEDILRKSAFALMEQPMPVSLIAIPKLLTDADYRRQILQQVKNPVVNRYFESYEALDKRFREEIITAPINKLDALTTAPLLRDIIGQARSSFDFRWLLDQNKILLCNLSKGALGEDASSLLGSIIFTKLWLAALSRQDVPEDQRPQHVLYGDEVQNFIHGIPLSSVLPEARKYHFSLVLCTQTIASLPDKATISAVFGNCASLISFRVASSDADTLIHEFGIVMPASELQHLDDFKAYIQTLLNGSPTDAHKVITFPAPVPVSTTRRYKIIRAARYARPRAEIEAKLNKFLAR